MRRPLRSVLVASLVVAPVVASPGLAGDDDRLVAKGEPARTIARAAEAAAGVGFTGAVLAAVDGKVLVALGVGSADLEGEVSNTANTLFEIASATKQFTGAAICELVERGKLELDDPIADHLPGVPDSCAEITVRHLLQHTSGIPGTNSRGGGDDLAAVVPIFLDGGPQREVGSKWEYWNQGYALLAGIVAQRSGDSYVEFCTKELFRKAKMKTACFTGDELPRGAVVAIGRSERGDRSALDHPYGSYGYQYQGMGGAVSNVWDLWRWDRALHGKKVLKEKAKKELFRPGLRDYALGWYVREKGGRTVHSHGGGVRGFVCDVRRYPGDDGALFVLCNRDGFPAYGLADLLERALFGAEVVMPPAALGPELQAALIGRYEDGRGRLFSVEADGAATKARIDWGGASGGGPTTRGFLGRSEEGELVLYDWHSATELEVGRTGAEPAASIRVGETTFER